MNNSFLSKIPALSAPECLCLYSPAGLAAIRPAYTPPNTRIPGAQPSKAKSETRVVVGILTNESRVQPKNAMRPTAPVPHGSVTCVRLSHPAKALSLRHSSPRSKLTLTSWRQPKTRSRRFRERRRPRPAAPMCRWRKMLSAQSPPRGGRRFPSGFQCGAARPVSRP